MPLKFWIILALSLAAGVAVLTARPTGRKRKPVPGWRQFKPPQPPP